MNENFRDRIEFRFPRNRYRNLMNALKKKLSWRKKPSQKDSICFLLRCNLWNILKKERESYCKSLGLQRIANLSSSGKVQGKHWIMGTCFLFLSMYWYVYALHSICAAQLQFSFATMNPTSNLEDFLQTPMDLLELPDSIFGPFEDEDTQDTYPDQNSSLSASSSAASLKSLYCSTNCSRWPSFSSALDDIGNLQL